MSADASTSLVETALIQQQVSTRRGRGRGLHGIQMTGGMTGGILRFQVRWALMGMKQRVPRGQGFEAYRAAGSWLAGRDKRRPRWCMWPRLRSSSTRSAPLLNPQPQGFQGGFLWGNIMGQIWTRSSQRGRSGSLDGYGALYIGMGGGGQRCLAGRHVSHV